MSLAALVTPALSQSGAGVSKANSDATVQGTVVNFETGTPLAGAAVSLAIGPNGTPGAGTRVTNAEGRFLFRQVPAGVYSVRATLLGYRTLQDTLRVNSASLVEVRLLLSVSPVALKPLVVVARRRALWGPEGLERRQRRGLGTFISREDIEEEHPFYVTDLFRMVPGARVVPTLDAGHAVVLRGTCLPDIWVDGVRIAGDLSLDHLLPPGDVEAVEVYRGSEVPVEFGPVSCGAIVVWTRIPRAAGGDNSFWNRRLLVAAGIMLLGWLFTR